jgi:hypothetical protein
MTRRKKEIFVSFYLYAQQPIVMVGVAMLVEVVFEIVEKDAS